MHPRDLGLIVEAWPCMQASILREGRGPVLGRALRIYPPCVRATERAVLLSRRGLEEGSAVRDGGAAFSRKKEARRCPSGGLVAFYMLILMFGFNQATFWWEKV